MQTPVHEGLRVVMDPIPDLTDAGLLPSRGLLFQCPPMEEFTVAYAHSHTDYDTLDQQQSYPGVPQLATIQFDTLVVDWGWYTLYDFDGKSGGFIEDFTDTMKEVCLSGSPFLLTAMHQIPPGGYANWGKTLAGAEMQFAATLRNLTISEKAGEGDARYLNVQFTEYREATQAIRTRGKKGGGVKLPTTVRLYKNGRALDVLGNKLADPPRVPLTLSWLAKHFYKDPSLARPLGQVNGLGNWGTTDDLRLNPLWTKLPNGGYRKIKIPKKATLAQRVSPLFS